MFKLVTYFFQGLEVAFVCSFFHRKHESIKDIGGVFQFRVVCRCVKSDIARESAFLLSQSVSQWYKEKKLRERRQKKKGRKKEKKKERKKKEKKKRKERKKKKKKKKGINELVYWIKLFAGLCFIPSVISINLRSFFFSLFLNLRDCLNWTSQNKRSFLTELHWKLECTCEHGRLLTDCFKVRCYN